LRLHKVSSVWKIGLLFPVLHVAIISASVTVIPLYGEFSPERQHAYRHTPQGTKSNAGIQIDRNSSIDTAYIFVLLLAAHVFSCRSNRCHASSGDSR
jgi:hypothetical protein